MQRGGKMRAGMIVAIFGIIIVIAALVVLYLYDYMRIDYSTVDHIKTMQRGPNTFSDLSGDIGVSGVEDIGYTVEGEYDLLIYYGKQRITVSPKAFNDADYRNALESIGIKIYTHVNDDGTILYRVTYWGEDVDRYTLTN